MIDDSCIFIIIARAPRKTANIYLSIQNLMIGRKKAPRAGAEGPGAAEKPAGSMR